MYQNRDNPSTRNCTIIPSMTSSPSEEFIDKFQRVSYLLRRNFFLSGITRTINNQERERESARARARERERERESESERARERA